MSISLQAELSQHPLSSQQIKSIAIDVACGLNYLHQWKPYPIIHRDVSSSNVLLKPCGANGWEAKVSDYGSANSIQQLSSYSFGPRNPAYAAPEASRPNEHSPKMDVYSFGVLLVEMSLREHPAASVHGRTEQAKMVQSNYLAEIIQRCLADVPDCRPTIALVLDELEDIQVCKSSSYNTMYLRTCTVQCTCLHFKQTHLDQRLVFVCEFTNLTIFSYGIQHTCRLIPRSKKAWYRLYHTCTQFKH